MSFLEQHAKAFQTNQTIIVRFEREFTAFSRTLGAYQDRIQIGHMQENTLQKRPGQICHLNSHNFFTK